MNILLTNDDGFYADGITTLKKELSRDHSVFVCAPISERSASSHSITLFKKMEIIKINEYEFALDGTPADCVKVALLHLFKDVPIDILISGINDGPNMGDDIFYSGTVAGAREGLLNNLFSIAASVDTYNKNKSFELPAKFISELLMSINKEILSKKLLLNINFPNSSSYKNVKITRLGRRIYKDSVIFETIDGKSFVTIGGEDPDYEYEKNSDLGAVADGYISITPITNEAFNDSIMETLSYLENKDWQSIKGI